LRSAYLVHAGGNRHRIKNKKKHVQTAARTRPARWYNANPAHASVPLEWHVSGTAVSADIDEQYLKYALPT